MAKKEKIVTDPFGSYTGLVRHPPLPVVYFGSRQSPDFFAGRPTYEMGM